MTHPHRALRITLIGLALAAGVVAAHAQESTWEKFKSYAHDRKHDAIAEGKRLIAETDKKIAALKKEARHSSAETQAAHERNMAELESKKKAAQAELAKMEKATSGVWGATREGVANAYRDLHQAAEKAAKSAKN